MYVWLIHSNEVNVGLAVIDSNITVKERLSPAG